MALEGSELDYLMELLFLVTIFSYDSFDKVYIINLSTCLSPKALML